MSKYSGVDPTLAYKAPHNANQVRRNTNSDSSSDSEDDEEESG